MVKKFLIFLVSAFFVVILGVSGWRVYKRKADLTSQIGVLEKEIEALREKEDVLRAQISESETEGYWEKRLREQGYKKPGEEVAVVLPPQDSGQRETGERPAFWQRFLEKLKFW